MKISVVQFDIKWEDLDGNLDEIERYVTQARNSGSELVLFPEMAVSGFSMRPDKVYIKRSHIEKIEELSKEIAIGIGYVEKCDSDFYNTYAIFKDGKNKCSYRKIHLFSHGGEDSCYKSGRKIEVVEVNGLRITPFICYDLRFPCIFQKVAQSTDLFVVSASWPSKRRSHWKSLLIARAIENQAYVAGVNRVGKDPYFTYTGDSAVADPWGEIILDARDEEGIFTAEVDLDRLKRIRERFPVLADRIRGIDL